MSDQCWQKVKLFKLYFELIDIYLYNDYLNYILLTGALFMIYYSTAPLLNISVLFYSVHRSIMDLIVVMLCEKLYWWYFKQYFCIQSTKNVLDINKQKNINKNVSLYLRLLTISPPKRSNRYIRYIKRYNLNSWCEFLMMISYIWCFI